MKIEAVGKVSHGEVEAKRLRDLALVASRSLPSINLKARKLRKNVHSITRTLEKHDEIHE